MSENNKTENSGMNAGYIQINAEDKKETQTRYGTSNQNYAQVVNYESLQRILSQNVSKTQTKTYAQYTKEKLQNYIKSPLANINNIRDVSAFLYRISHNYKKIIEYYALCPMFSYNVSYRAKDWTSPLSQDEFMDKYKEVCYKLDKMGLRDMCPRIISTCLRDGIYTGFCYDSDDGFFISSLDPKYCKISSITEGNTYVVKFDATYFDVGNNKDFLYGTGVETDLEDGLWDEVFIEGYENFKTLGNDYRWFELPLEKTICVICGDDPVLPLPYFLPVFNSLLDLLDYESLIRSKAELENYVLLLSKVPLNDKSGEVNDFSVDLDIVKATQEAIDEVSPSLVGSAWTPCDVDKIEFGNRNQVEDTNIYSTAISNLFKGLGISEMIFTTNKTNSVGLKHSIAVDMTLPLEILKRIGANIQRYLNLNVTTDFAFKFHDVSVFNVTDYMKTLKEQATLGIPVKMDYATALGKTPYEVMNDTFVENALNLTDKWTPLVSSYTQSSKEVKSEDELSEEGLKTREGDKNAGTEAEK